MFLAARPRRSACMVLLCVTLATLLLAGCRADPPVLPVSDQSASRDLMVDVPADCPNPPTLAAPTVDKYSDPTPYARQPFRGTSAGAAMISVRGGTGEAKPASVGTDGRFCIEVVLNQSAQNTLVFTPIDSRGCPGKETAITIKHQPVAGADGGGNTITNVALKAAATSKDGTSGGTVLGHVNDGDPSTYAEFTFQDLDTDCGSGLTWFRVDLGKVYTLGKGKILWAPAVGQDYAKCYAVAISSLTSPGEPTTTPGNGWEVVKQEPANGTAAAQEFDAGQRSGRWVAVFLYENGGLSLLQEVFKVAELEVLGQDPDATQPPTPDRCQ